MERREPLAARAPRDDTAQGCAVASGGNEAAAAREASPALVGLGGKVP